jgi:aminoglycoside phosphotransferase (APT) family kinase protein
LGEMFNQADGTLLSAASLILAKSGETLVEASFLADGTTCRVWKLRSRTQSYALRVMAPGQNTMAPKIEALVRRKILARGGRVATPVQVSMPDDDALPGMSWSLDVFVDGCHPLPGKLSDDLCDNLGRTLALLHDVPVFEFGRPADVVGEVIAGNSSKPERGADLRFRHSLPESWEPGFLHPALVAAPDTRSEVLAHLGEVTHAVNQGSAVLCHSDLHEGQLICRESQLEALIDFASATILDRHWEFGGLMYFHGFDGFKKVHRAYVTYGGKACSIELTRSFSIAVALHDACRATQPGLHHRMVKVVKHIREMIA